MAAPRDLKESNLRLKTPDFLNPSKTYKTHFADFCITLWGLHFTPKSVLQEVYFSIQPPLRHMNEYGISRPVSVRSTSGKMCRVELENRADTCSCDFAKNQRWRRHVTAKLLKVPIDSRSSSGVAISLPVTPDFFVGPIEWIQMNFTRRKSVEK